MGGYGRGVTDMPLPLTVLGGYLGAGKTTLLNRVLAGGHGRRVAVIVNDFGEVDLDALQIVDAGTPADRVVELANGCACCAVSDGLVEVFDLLSERRGRFDHVVLEASGVADPARLAAWGTVPGFRVAAVVVMADVGRIRALATDRWVATTIERQLAAADLVVLSHTDLVDARDGEIDDAVGDVVADVRRWIRDGYGDVPVVDAARIDPVDVVLDMRVDVDRPAVGDHDDPHRSSLICIDGDVDVDALLDVLGAAGLLRAKGLVRDTAGSAGVVDVVGRRTTWRPLATAHDPEVVGRIVAIVADPEVRLDGLAGALRAAGVPAVLPG